MNDASMSLGGEQRLVHARYDSLTIWLHWATAALVLALWVIGMTADWLPRGPLRGEAWSVHVLLGFAAGVVLVARLAWRLHGGRALPLSGNRLLQMAAKATHGVLYLLLAAVIVSGIVNASYRGFVLFDLWPLPHFGAGDRAIRRSINGWHELAANATLVVAFLHAAAALVHHYVWRDGTLARMRPF